MQYMSASACLQICERVSPFSMCAISAFSTNLNLCGTTLFPRCWT